MQTRFAAVGLNHGHIYGQVNCMLNAGAELVWVYAKEPELVEPFLKAFPQAKVARSEEEVLEDESIHLIASAGIPIDRAPLGIRAMQHGKDYMSDKPGFATLEQLAEAKKVQSETGRFYTVYFSERLSNHSTARATELVQAGAIGRVYQVIGLGPHRIGVPSNRPDWFFDTQYFGGIINDIASHQVDQFLHFTGNTDAEIVSSQVANFAHPQYPKFEDFGDLVLKGANGGAGYIRIDWFTPDGLSTWGDVRLFVMGTDGYIELRKNCDVGGREGSDHLFLVDQKEMQYIDCSDTELPFGPLYVNDIHNRTETAMTQAHSFRASELALQAQEQATRLSALPEK
jgi:predicted dehydrogenase